MAPPRSNIDASTVLRPKEAALLRPRLWLAQDTSGPTPADIFKDPETLAAELQTLGPAGHPALLGHEGDNPRRRRHRRACPEGRRRRVERRSAGRLDRPRASGSFLGTAGPESKIDVTIRRRPRRLWRIRRARQRSADVPHRHRGRSTATLACPALGPRLSYRVTARSSRAPELHPGRPCRGRLYAARRR